MSAPVHVGTIELTTPLADVVAPAAYTRARLLVLVDGTPIDSIDVALERGVCPAVRVRDAVLGCAAAIARHLLGDALGLGTDRAPGALAALLRTPSSRAFPTIAVTAAVCTRDRAVDLQSCLEALCASDLPGADLLVVDNGSTSCLTREVAGRFAPRVRYVSEPCPGLDWARNRAIASTTAEVIAFTDDDVIVSPGWLSSLSRVFAESPEVMGVTGLVAPAELETPAQALFETYGGFGRGYRRRWVRAVPGTSATTVFGNAGTLGTGANMAFRRRVFGRIGLFDPALDVGTPTRGAGDLDMFFRVGAAGHTFVYEPRAYVGHRHRRDDAQLRRQIGDWGSGMAAYLAANRDRFPRERRALALLGARLLGLYAPRRLAQALAGGPIPASLVAREVAGAIAGPRRYRESVTAARALASEYGYPAFATPVIAPPAIGPAVEVTVDLRRPLQAFPSDAPGSLRVLVTDGDARLGWMDVAHGECGVSSARLRDEVVGGFGPVLLGDLDAHRAALSAVLA